MRDTCLADAKEPGRITSKCSQQQNQGSGCNAYVKAHHTGDTGEVLEGKDAQYNDHSAVDSIPAQAHPPAMNVTTLEV